MVLISILFSKLKGVTSIVALNGLNFGQLLIVRSLELVRAAMEFSLLIYRVHFRSQFGFACRFEPSCSCYAKEALEQHSMARATGFILWRLLRCHPFSSGGYDPVRGVDCG